MVASDRRKPPATVAGGDCQSVYGFPVFVGYGLPFSFESSVQFIDELSLEKLAMDV